MNNYRDRKASWRRGDNNDNTVAVEQYNSVLVKEDEMPCDWEGDRGSSGKYNGSRLGQLHGPRKWEGARRGLPHSLSNASGGHPCYWPLLENARSASSLATHLGHD